MNLINKIKSLPSNSGIYKYFDENGKLLYIGKAKDLKKRVSSYFKFTPALSPSPKLSDRISLMIQQTRFLEYLLVNNAHGALILENSLIKQLKPKYNILLRDDKSYPYIYYDKSSDFPRLDITRRLIKSSTIKYFGPYSSGARDILDSIYEIVPLVQKTNCIKGKKACLFYQINRCKAPCEGKITKLEYASILEQALELLSDNKKLISYLKNSMQEASKQQNFEQAVILRDRIKKLERTQIVSSMDIAKMEDFDIFAVAIKDNFACIMQLFLRDGKIVSSEHSLINIQENISKDEIYTRFLVNFYTKDLPFVPKTILIHESFEELNDINLFIKEKFNKNIELKVPLQGLKKQLTTLAYLNAIEILNSKNTTPNTILTQLKKLLNLQNIPYEIEIFDNSHNFGQATVGACVCFSNEAWQKDRYRHYNLESKDEYSQMKEMLTKRVESFDKNPPPDLWIIDGGQTLLKLAIDIVDSCGVNLDVIAISKEKKDKSTKRARGSAKDIIHTKLDSLKLSSDDKRLQFVQNLRDEAHRFAISFHRKQKQKEDLKSALLEQKGFSKAKIKRLINYFGTFEAIENASQEEIKEALRKK